MFAFIAAIVILTVTTLWFARTADVLEKQRDQLSKLSLDQARTIIESSHDLQLMADSRRLWIDEANRLTVEVRDLRFAILGAVGRDLYKNWDHDQVLAFAEKLGSARLDLQERWNLESQAERELADSVARLGVLEPDQRAVIEPNPF